MSLKTDTPKSRKRTTAINEQSNRFTDENEPR